MNAVSGILFAGDSGGSPVWPPACCRVVIAKIRLGQPWLCLAPVLRLPRMTALQPLWVTCAVLHCPPGEEDFPLSAVGQ